MSITHVCWFLCQEEDPVKNSLDETTKRSLQTAMSLCQLSSSVSDPDYQTPLPSDDLLDPLTDTLALDDWLNVGPEEATLTLMPEVFRLLDVVALTAVDWPGLWDLVYLTAWFYAGALLIGLIVAWANKLHIYILHYYNVEVET